MKNSPEMVRASMALAELLQEVYHFPLSDLPIIDECLPDIGPNDFVTEQVPLFMQQMDALWGKKVLQLKEAEEMGDAQLQYKFFTERQVLHAMLTYFAAVAVPPEFFGKPYEWAICKGFVLVYREYVPKDAETEEADEPQPKPEKTKRTLN